MRRRRSRRRAAGGRTRRPPYGQEIWLDKLSTDLLNYKRGRGSSEKGRAVRGDRADGQGVREPDSARVARSAGAGTAHRPRARPGERAVGGEHLAASAGAAGGGTCLPPAG